MKKVHKIIIMCACLVACALVAMAFCFLYVGTDEVEDTPSTLTVQQVEGQMCLVTQFSSKWTYRFAVEQEIDGVFYAVDEVSSDVNTVALSAFQVSLVAGNAYRFSACYVNGNITGNWSEKLTWTATWALSTPTNLTEADGVLSWDAVEDADGYNVTCVSSNGEQSFPVSTNSFDLSVLSAGSYTIYVRATSSNEFLTISDAASFSWTA